MTNHSVIGPSKSHRWLNCSRSVIMERDKPENQNDAALEGDAAHWVAEKILTSYKLPGDIYHPQPGDKTNDGYEITEQMIDGAKLYVTDVLKIAQNFGGMSKLMIEDTVSIPRIHQDCFGTVDCWVFDEKLKTLYVWDFKFGRRLVNVTDNSQLTCYAIGIIDQLGIDDQEIIVDMRIVQPRAFHVLGPVRNKVCYGSDLRALGNQLHGAAHDAIKGEGAFKTGDHCSDCMAKTNCSAFINASLNAIDVIDNTSDEVELTPNERSILISTLRTGKKRLEKLLSAIEEETSEMINQGVTIPGFVNGRGQSAEVWAHDDDFVKTLGDCLGVDLRKEGVKTPKQAQKLIVNSDISDYTKIVPGKVKLTQVEETLAYHVFKPRG